MSEDSTLRLCFSKDGPLRFIGHLDFLRTFQQTVRRAGLPVAYSQGFNPHMRLSFALPLPLGMAAARDYADMVMEKELPFEDIVRDLNARAPEGLRFLQASAAEGNIAAMITAAAYSFETDAGEDRARAVWDAETLIVPKKTKSGVKDVDIRPDIFSLRVVPARRQVLMRLAAGSKRFLNPLTVAALIDPAATAARLVRLDLFTDPL